MKLFVALVVVIVLFWMARRRTSRRASPKREPLRHEFFKSARSAKPGSFDESFFVNPKTGGFRFPRYRSPRNALVTVKDMSAYREDIWPDLDPDEKRNFSIKAFEYHFVGADIDIEEFSGTLVKPANPVYESFPFLRRKGGELEDLAWEFESTGNAGAPGSHHTFADSEMARDLVKQGCLQKVEFQNAADSEGSHRAYLEGLKVPDLKALCVKVGQRVAGRKAELVERLMHVRGQLDLPPAVRKTEGFDRLLDELRDAYVNDVRKSIDSWHPAVIEEVWEVVTTDACDAGVEGRAKRLLKERYWAERYV